MVWHLYRETSLAIVLTFSWVTSGRSLFYEDCKIKISNLAQKDRTNIAGIAQVARPGMGTSGYLVTHLYLHLYSHLYSHLYLHLCLHTCEV